ncbi:MAG: DUF445 family protein, partial [Spirochaetaceae bacterium]|nr:DUF445 family protein [Spirochaetaceae bacterium]
MLTRFLVSLAASVLSGAAAGYATNSLAVTMLFKKICGKFGGVIERSYKDFIVNISGLVESDLLNDTTLAAAIQTSQFREVVHALVRDIAEIYLPRETGGGTLAEIPGFEQSVQNLAALAGEISPDILRGIAAAFGEKPIGGVVSAGQYRHIVQHICGVLAHNQDELEAGIVDILKTFTAAHPIHTLVYKNELHTILANTERLVHTIQFEKHESDFDACFADIHAQCTHGPLSAALEEALEKTPFSYIENEARHFAEDALARAADYAHTTEGAALLCATLESALAAAAAIHVPLETFTRAGDSQALRRAAEACLPAMARETAAFIRANSARLEALINSAIDEQLEKSGWGALLKSAKDMVSGNFAQEYGIVEEIARTAGGYEHDAARRFCAAAGVFVHEHTAGSAAALLVQKGVINAETLALHAQKALDRLAGKPVRLPSALRDKTLGGLFPGVFSRIYTDGVPFLYGVFKRRFLLNGRGARMALAALAKKIDAPHAPSGGQGSAPEPSGFFPLEFFRAALLAQEDAARGLRFDACCAGVPTGTGAAWLRRFAEKNKHYRLPDIYTKINSPALYDKSSAVILALVNDNIKKIISGNISNLVYSQLSACTPAQINALVQNFIGKELRP